MAVDLGGHGPGPFAIDQQTMVHRQVGGKRVENADVTIAELPLGNAPVECVADDHVGRRRQLDRHLISQSERHEELGVELGVGERGTTRHVAEPQRSTRWFHQDRADQRVLCGRQTVVHRLELFRKPLVVCWNDHVPEIARRERHVVERRARTRDQRSQCLEHLVDARRGVCRKRGGGVEHDADVDSIERADHGTR